MEKDYKIAVDGVLCKIPPAKPAYIDQVLKENTLCGLDSMSDKYTNGDTVAICNDFYANNTIFLPDEVKKAELVGTDPKSGKAIVKFSDGGTKNIDKKTTMDFDTLKKISNINRGNAIAAVLGGSAYSIKVSKFVITVCTISIVFSIFIAMLLNSHALYSIFVAVLIIASECINLKNKNKDIDMWKKKLLLFTCYRYAACNLGLFDKKENSEIVNCYIHNLDNFQNDMKPVLETLKSELGKNQEKC